MLNIGDSVIVIEKPKMPIMLQHHAEVILGLLGTTIRPVSDAWLVDFYGFGQVLIPSELLAQSRHQRP